MKTLQGWTLRAPVAPEHAFLWSPEAQEFLRELAVRFEAPRQALLAARRTRQVALSRGAMPDFLAETADAREDAWQVANAPADLEDRRVEITGPAEPKMMINALNSGASVFMADLEDACSPTWFNVMEGQRALYEAVRGTLSFKSGDGKGYRLQQPLATLLVRPRGWHLSEKHVLWGDAPISASLFDFGLYFFHNARERLTRGTGPYFYLPKLESHLEARLWNEVFLAAQELLGLPRGTVRATVLIENILAAFEMEEILFELREHASGLNAGRWDYIFSVIKKFRDRPAMILPDRAQVTMEAPFMRAYSDLLVQTCHRRGAHAIGGMAAYIPSRKDPLALERALAGVRADKVREAHAGFDGTWVAHPDLVAVARAEFDRRLGDRPHQKERLREDVHVQSRDLLDVAIPGGTITEAGVRLNLNVGILYLAHWLGGQGAVGIHHLMEDAATAEISRAQLWQWLRHGVRLADGRALDPALYRSWRNEELSKLPPMPHLAEAATLMDRLVLDASFAEFLTLPTYEILEG